MTRSCSELLGAAPFTLLAKANSGGCGEDRAGTLEVVAWGRGYCLFDSVGWLY